eukprot:1316499-Prymnesium_polylepis.2
MSRDRSLACRVCAWCGVRGVETWSAGCLERRAGAHRGPTAREACTHTHVVRANWANCED